MQQKDLGLGSLRSWIVVFTAGAFFFYSFIQMTLFTTVEMQGYFKDVLSLETTAAFGNFAGMFLYGTVLFLLPIGVLLDRVSVKTTILAMLALVVICVFGMAYTSNVYVAMVLRFVTGIAHCVAFMAPFRLAPRWFGSRQLALVAGLLVTFAVFGGWVSGVPMLALITAFGGKTTMLINGALGIVIFVIAAIALRDFPEGHKEVAAGRGLTLGEGLKIAVQNKQNWLAGTYIGTLNLSVLLLAAIWGTNYLKSVSPELADKPTTVTGIIGMILIGTMIGSPIQGWLSDQLQSRKKAMLGGAILSLVVMLLIMFPPSTNTILLYALFLALGLFTAAQSIGYPVIAESNEDEVLGTANGLSAVILMGIGAIGQPLFGFMVTLMAGAEATDAETQVAFQMAIWVMPVAFVGAIFCALMLDETFKRES